MKRLNTMIQKPWGREWCAYSTKQVAVWVLEINNRQMTSLHAHPLKCTAFVVLKGQIALHLLRGKPIVLNEGDKINIFRGRFHRIVACSDAVLLEIESPNNKRNIFRLEDRYGREKQPIEEDGTLSAPYLLPVNGSALRIHGSTIRTVRCLDNVRNRTDNTVNDIYVTLRGGLTNNLLPPGEAIDGASLQRLLTEGWISEIKNSMFMRIITI